MERKYKQSDEKTTFTIDPDYVEFGFEFDIIGGTRWPYTDIFWNEERSKSKKVDTIDVHIGGTVRFAAVTILVNGKTEINRNLR